MAHYTRRATTTLAALLCLLLALTPPLEQRARAASTLLGYWKFEEGSGAEAADSSGNNRAGSLEGSFVWSTDVPPVQQPTTYALGFSGGQAVTIPYSPAFEANQLTVSAWIKPTWTSHPGYNPTIFSMRDEAGTRWSLHLRGDYSAVDFYNGDVAPLYTEVPQPNVWTHVALVLGQQGRYADIYIDGVLGTRYNRSFNAGATGKPFTIGANGIALPHGEHFIGLLDEVRLYDGALSPAEIASLGPPCSGSVVVTSAADSGPGTLRQALDDICQEGTITFDGDHTIALQSKLNVQKNVTIDGGAHEIVLDGAQSADPQHDGGILFVDYYLDVKVRNLTFVNGHAHYGGAIASEGMVTVTGSTFSGNSASFGGGAIHSDGGSVISASTFVSNTAEVGGALLTQESSTVISASTFLSNTADSGGAIMNWNTLTIADSSFRWNVAGEGGAIANGDVLDLVGTSLISNTATTSGGAIDNEWMLTITGSTIAGNAGGDEGGGIASSWDLSVSDSTIAGNTAGKGAGIVATGNFATIVDSTIAGNIAANGGGGLLQQARWGTVSGSTFAKNRAGTYGGALAGRGSGITSTTAITNSTFFGNEAETFGGALVFDDASASIANSTFSDNAANNGGAVANVDATVMLSNAILANSSAGGDCLVFPEATLVLKNILVEDGSCGATLTGDPLLAPLGDYGGATQTFALLPGSPAVDAGDPGVCPAADQRGVGRPQGGGCDLGAFESRGFHLQIVSGDGQTGPLGGLFPSPLVVQLVGNDSGVTGGAGQTISFNAPPSGPSLSPVSFSAITDASGVVTASVTANAFAGSYGLTASSPWATAPVTFTLSQAAMHQLALSIDGAGAGTVASQPAGLSCSSSCSGYFLVNSQVTLSATPDGGSLFAGWGGSCAGLTLTCTLTLDQARSASASFVPIETRVLLPGVTR